MNIQQKRKVGGSLFKNIWYPALPHAEANITSSCLQLIIQLPEPKGGEFFKFGRAGNEPLSIDHAREYTSKHRKHYCGEYCGRSIRDKREFQRVYKPKTRSARNLYQADVFYGMFETTGETTLPGDWVPQTTSL